MDGVRILKGSNKSWLAALLLAGLLPASANATLVSAFRTVPCSIIMTIFDVVRTVGSSLVLVMFVYGGARYIFSADNPSGRNQGKMICIHAIIGAIILMLWTGVGVVLSNTFWQSC